MFAIQRFQRMINTSAFPNIMLLQFAFPSRPFGLPFCLKCEEIDFRFGCRGGSAENVLQGRSKLVTSAKPIAACGGKSRGFHDIL